MTYPPQLSPDSPPPQGPYPPPSGPPNWPPQQPFQDPYTQAEQQKAGLFKAGKYGIWVMIALIVTPVLVIVLCCAGCWGMGLLGSVLPAADPTATP